MDTRLRILLPIMGRILIGGFFLLSGISKALAFLSFSQIFANTPIPHPLVLAILILAVEVALGIALIVDYRTRLVALFGCGYVLLSSMSFFGILSALQTELFLENMALIGALMMLAAYQKRA